MYLGAVELCDGLDNDCDGLVDNGAFYTDGDGDGYGDPASLTATCSIDLVLDGTDCDDGNANIYPGATETCDGVDEDCDMDIDNGLVFETYYPDVDEDGYGPYLDLDLDFDGFGSTTVEICPGASTDGYVAVGTDCDDDDPAVHPGAQEVCDGLDQNCVDGPDDGLIFDLWYPDDDSDGFGDLGDPGVPSCDGAPAFSMVLDTTDCDDADEDVFPGALEVCDGIDNDCDGVDDPALVDHWPDLDGDGLGDQEASPEATCDPSSDQVPNDDDCNDDLVGDQCTGAGQAASGCKCQGSPGGGAWVLILLAAVSRRRIG